ncbi:hypothetical protein [Acinetobacter guillouiae]|uniref:hypothetical protein n=1 Tax=Acinetobacter guillouiae TaxID=106649 RepID=UPI0028EA98AD|nr:hypothetical protein [Acinetobacter guillouiae]
MNNFKNSKVSNSFKVGRFLTSFILLFSLGLIACSNNNNEKTVEKTQAEIDQDALDYREKVIKQQQALADEDRPQVEVPAVDYTSPVAKVDLKNDQEIIAAVGLPVVEKEKGSNQNGEPMTTYYFSQDLSNGLELSLSREFVDVVWKYDSKAATKSNAAFKAGQQITRALLGGKDGAALYEMISKGGNAESYVLKDGTEIHNARCGQFMCRYQVVR